MANPVFDESSSNRDTSRGLSWWFSDDPARRGPGAGGSGGADGPVSPRRMLFGQLVSHPGRLTILYFAGLIVAVTAVLLLPASSREPGSTDFPTAFFTAVSALSTCGIPVVNTAEHWTALGQAVILVSVQLGGLGVMTFASIITLAISRHLKVQQRLLTANELGTSTLSEVRSVLAIVLVTTFSIEAITMIALFPGLFRLNGERVGPTLWEALFYAVSSYNNTGFTPDAAGLHVNSWAVGLPVLVAAFIGTLGFPVILDLVRSLRGRRRPRRWMLHTKLTLLTTFALVAVSLVWFLATEWDNPFLFKDADTATRLRSALSAAVMPRSSGFDLSWVPQVSEETKVFMSAMMFIGGGSSSTAGGIRVTTFAVVLLICRAAFSGREEVSVFRRRIPRRIRMTAVSVTTACFTLVAASSLALMFVTGRPLTDALFETCSAFSLGGYTVGVADASNPATLFILAGVMVVGRLGPMTIAYSISRPREAEAVHYPPETLVVG